jgi:hypothetical protein
MLTVCSEPHDMECVTPGEGYMLPFLNNIRYIVTYSALPGITKVNVAILSLLLIPVLPS